MQYKLMMAQKRCGVRGGGHVVEFRGEYTIEGCEIYFSCGTSLP